MESPYFFGAIGFALAALLLPCVRVAVVASGPADAARVPPAVTATPYDKLVALDRLLAASIADARAVLKDELVSPDHCDRLRKVLYQAVYCRLFVQIELIGQLSAKIEEE